MTLCGIACDGRLGLLAGGLHLDQPVPACDQHRGHLVHRPSGGESPPGVPLRVPVRPGPHPCYLALGVLLVASVLSVHELAMFLQRYMNKLLGPLLIVVAMFLLD